MKKLVHKASPTFQYFKSNFIRYLPALLAPLVIGIVLSVFVFHIESEEADTLGNISIQYFKSQVSSLLDSIEDTAHYLTIDQDFLEMIGDELNDKNDSFKICSIINHYIEGNDLVGSVYLLVPNHDRIYTNFGYFEGNSLSSLITPLGIAIPGSATLDTVQLQQGWNVFNEGLFAPVYVASIPTSSSNATLIMTLKMDSLISILTEIDAELCCIFTDEYSLSTIVSAYEEPDWYSTQEISSLLGKKVKCFYLRETSYTYLVAISVDGYYRTMRLLAILLLGYIAILSVIVLCNLAVVSEKRLRHLTNITKKISDNVKDDDIVYSDEYFYDQINSTLNDYERIRIDALSHQTSVNISALLTGTLNEGQFRRNLLNSGLPDTGCRYIVVSFSVMINMSVLDAFSTQDSSEVDSFLHMILSEAAQAFSDSYFFCIGALTEQLYPIIFAVPADHDIQISEVVSRISDYIYEKYKIKTRAIISNKTTDVNALPSLWHENIMTNRFMFSCEEDNVIQTNGYTEDLDEIRRLSFLKQLQMLINSLLNKHYDSVSETVDLIISENIDPYPKNQALPSLRIMALSGILAEGAINSGRYKDIHEISGRFFSATSIPSLRSLTAVTFDGMDAEHLIDAAVERTCELIQKEYTDSGLSINYICDQIGLSQQYLNKKFKQNLGVTISDYLNECRLSRSIKLLQETNLSINEISEQVGYTRVETFIRNFKTSTGLTPGEYRKSARA